MKPAEHRCAACDEPLTPPAGRGRPARFCGAACRMAAQRRRRRGMPEALPRWAHARGRLSLDRAADWEAEAVTRALARQQREELAAQRRALRRWHQARTDAARLGVLHGAPAPSAAAAAAWKAIRDAAAECAALGVAGGGADQVAAAERRMQELAPVPLSRAERRRRELEVRRAARRLFRHA